MKSPNVFFLATILVASLPTLGRAETLQTPEGGDVTRNKVEALRTMTSNGQAAKSSRALSET